MTSLEVGGSDGTSQEIPYSGQIVFTEFGTMSVQAMNADPDAAPTGYTAMAYEATYGQFTVSADQKILSFAVTLSLVRDLIGQTLDRALVLTTTTLVLTPTDPTEAWRVSYVRL